MSSLSVMKTTHQAEPRLGVDIGRVIIAGDGPDTNFIGGSEDEAMRAPAIPGALESLARLTRRFERRVWIVSKCGKKVEGRSRAWLDRHRFFERTDIPRANLRFCKDRRDKTPICDELGIDFFVDDRLDVLLPMAGIVPHRILFGTTSSPSPGIHAARTWEIAEELIFALLNARDESPVHAT